MGDTIRETETANVESARVYADEARIQASDAVPEVRSVARPDGHGDYLVVRDGYRIERLDGRLKNKRAHRFHDLDSLATYLNRHAIDRTATEIFVDEGEVVAALDPKSVTGDVVKCDLPLDPLWDSWLQAFRARLSQRDMHALIRSNRDSLATDTASMLLASLRSLRISAGTELRCDIDETGYTRFAATSGKTEVSGKIPPHIEITVPVYEGVLKDGDTALYSIEVLVHLETSQGVVFQLEPLGMERVQRQARRDVAEHLKELLEEEFLVGLGRHIVSDVPQVS